MVWIDCEMTGLNVETDNLIEVAALVTDANLNVLGDGVDIIIRPSAAALAQMDAFVRDMHTSSGLLECLDGGLSLAEAEDQVLEYVKTYVPQAGKVPLAGNSVGMDRAFLARYMPKLESYVHYRNIDVSSIKELAKRWYPKVYYNAPEKASNHRALADIIESIEELRFYRETIFVAKPGPSADEVKELVAKHRGTLPI
ncbi:MAG: oligoribonuclease [Propionibacteriaceae bacterium]|nr:oligoribonuclease [Propionibacteriaceae bacterium]